MPLETSTYGLDEEIESMEREREEKAERLAKLPDDSPATEQLAERGQTLTRYLSGLRWYREEFDADSITLGALTNGERNRIQQVVQEASGSGVQQNAYVAQGTLEAAYLGHDPEETTMGAFKDTVRAVADLHPAFVDWAESEITDLGRMDGEMGNSFRDLVQAKKTQATADQTNG
jgi:hypothetical protein